MLCKYFFSFLIFLALAGCHPASTPSRSTEQITSHELREHVQYLASDELEGRASGTQGNDLAASYISEQFSRYGLQPISDDGYFQRFQVLSAVKPGKNNYLNVTVKGTVLEFSPDEEFRPLFFSADTSVSGSLVFVGYGIFADSLHFNDYASVDVRGKIVLAFRFTPDYGRPDSKFYDHASLYRKAFVALQKGAIGIIFVTGPSDEEKPSLMPMRLEGNITSSIAAVQLISTLADSILQLAGSEKNLRTLQQEIYDAKAPRSFELSNVSVRLQTGVQRIYSTTSNVLGYFEGNDTTSKNQMIILGAHFDHVGRGGHGSGSLQPDTTAIHNGADDNASGTAALLELAQSLSSQRHTLKRSYLFAAFSGEEMGLLGSAHYVKQPIVPLERTIAMINVDMIGRLRDSALTVEGIGTSPAWKPILEKENASFHFKLRLGQGGYGPSDHSSFYGKDIPVLFFFTGLHGDYHRPSDDWDKLNYEGEQRIVQYISQVVKKLDEWEKPVFTRVQASSADSLGRRGFRILFGIIPDYSGGNIGLKISGTRPASPAEKAGLREGDIIIKFGGQEVKTIYDLTYLLGNYNPGDDVEIVFKRDVETKTVTVKLEARR